MVNAMKRRILLSRGYRAQPGSKNFGFFWQFLDFKKIDKLKNIRKVLNSQKSAKRI